MVRFKLKNIYIIEITLKELCNMYLSDLHIIKHPLQIYLYINLICILSLYTDRKSGYFKRRNETSG